MRFPEAVAAGIIMIAASAGILRSAQAGTSDFLKEEESWRSKRLERLQSETSWLTLVGLYWLKPGENRFGTDASNDVVLPQGSGPAYAGSFFLDNGKVRARASENSGLTLNGGPVDDGELRGDDSETIDELRLNSLRMYVIERGERFGIRAKDPESPTRKEFRGLTYFPPDPAYRLSAEFVPYESAKEVHIPTVLGTVETMKAPGYVKFSLQGMELTLEPVLETPSAKDLFFIFKDATSEHETYGSGRFLYSELPVDGRVTLDFNRAYNPPCAFTPYATCPLPPKANLLPLRIEAGEKKYGNH